MPQPRFSKKDDYTIRITIDKIDEVPLAQLIKNKEQLIEGRKKMYQAVKDQEIVITKRIKDIDEILAKAKTLGIVAKPVPEKPEPPKIRKIKEGSESKEE